ncbi:hypothetical protein PKOR_23115 [Pontibacter korlensis]|uniref:Uncharacterized protein n=1 Tax=Pontibacter korlensis TaxID=400092 RepID=A0A0E3UYS5_9BACT|nr:hypothetical protein PKOR_23115 [Pontibacter korlensis]
MSSCQKEDSAPQTDYSIESDSNFELISQHSNGWIKKARHYSYDLQGNVPKDEFEYFENGYVKSAKVYSRFPNQHLYMEVSRSEDNKPLWSKYYTPEGELWFETEYVNGLPSVKKVYSGKGTAVHTYTDGELVSIGFTATDNSGTSTTVYDRSSGKKTITVTQNGETVLEEEYSFLEKHGDGIQTSNQIPLANPFNTTEEGAYRKVEESFSHSPVWENDTDPIKIIHPYRHYFEYNYYHPQPEFATKFAVNSELYQSVIEQYPVTEDGALIAGTWYHQGFESFLPSLEESDSLQNVKEQDPDLFELKYGNEYVEKVRYGKHFFVIGALRNMPTNENAADELKKIAERRMNELLTGNSPLSREEREILEKVWFEAKFFSMLNEHRNGVVINSYADYESAVQEVNNAEVSIIQLEYVPFRNL